MWDRSIVFYPVLILQMTSTSQFATHLLAPGEIIPVTRLHYLRSLHGEIIPVIRLHYLRSLRG